MSTTKEMVLEAIKTQLVNYEEDETKRTSKIIGAKVQSKIELAILSVLFACAIENNDANRKAIAQTLSELYNKQYKQG